jgi:hypothetical protein
MAVCLERPGSSFSAAQFTNMKSKKAFHTGRIAAWLFFIGSTLESMAKIIFGWVLFVDYCQPMWQ